MEPTPASEPPGGAPVVYSFLDFSLADFEQVASVSAASAHIADAIRTEGIFALVVEETDEAAELNPFALEKRSAEDEGAEALSRLGDALPRVPAFQGSFPEISGDRVLRVGRVAYDRPIASANDARELDRLGFGDSVLLFRCSAFLVGTDAELVVCAFASGEIDEDKVASVYKSVQPRLPDSLDQEFRALTAREPPRPKKLGKGKGKGAAAEDQQQAAVAAVQAFRAERREALDRAAALLQERGASPRDIQQELTRLAQNEDRVSSTPVVPAPEAVVEAHALCIRGGLHPVHASYRTPGVRVFIDSSDLMRLQSDGVDARRWATISGGTPSAVFFIPVPSFLEYARQSCVLADLVKKL